MNICLISTEIFAWGKYGGFGRSTRMIGRELVKYGFDVTAVVPRRAGQKAVEMLDGIRVFGFNPRNPFSALELFRAADADIYHSQEPSFSTYLAQLAMPHRKHMITFRDTRNILDWRIELLYPSLNYPQVIFNFLYEDNFLVHRAVRKANLCFVASPMLIPKALKKYKLTYEPEFLPSPIPFLEKVNKSETPLVCFVGRLDKRKRPEIFFDLTESFPQVQFDAVGGGRNSKWEQKLISRYEKIPNLNIRGFMDQFSGNKLAELFSRSWVLVNTSARESLPTTFIEAAGHGCAILSENDPGGFSSMYGYHVTDADYVKGLQSLLANDNWLEKGKNAMQYTHQIFSINASIEKHIQAYAEVL